MQNRVYVIGGRASVASETLTGGNTIENRGCLFIYWRASIASETVLGVDNAKSGICYMYIMYTSGVLEHK